MIIKNGFSLNMNNIKERMATAISPVDLITDFAKLKNALATIATTMTCNPVKEI